MSNKKKYGNINPIAYNEWEEDCIKIRGRILTGKFCHWCLAWNDLPIDETCTEWDCCNCFGVKNEQIDR